MLVCALYYFFSSCILKQSSFISIYVLSFKYIANNKMTCYMSYTVMTYCSIRKRTQDNKIPNLNFMNKKFNYYIMNHIVYFILQSALIWLVKRIVYNYILWCQVSAQYMFKLCTSLWYLNTSNLKQFTFLTKWN